MSKQLLIETRMNSLSLKEGVDKSQKRRGCLGTLVGPCADFKNPTRNGNFYSRKLWENSFKDPLVKESIEDLTCIGELDHPGDRLETKATNACIVFTGYEFDDENGVIIGTFDILDTPNGRILKSLIDYGCKIGVSSRGEGDVIEEADRTVVDEDAFEFVAFDAVVLPAVKAAKPALQESLSRAPLKESLQKEIDGAQTQSELSLIKSIVETINPPDSDALLESVNHKSQELASGATSSPALLEDLEKSMSKIQELTEEIDRLKSDLTTCKSKYNRQISDRQKRIQESKAQKSKMKELEEKYTSLVFESSSASRESESQISRLSESAKRSRDLLQDLRDQVESFRDKEKRSKSRIETLQNSLRESQEFGQEKLREVTQLREELSSLKSESRTTLKESTDRHQSEVRKLKSQISTLKESFSRALESYIDAKCKAEGVSPKVVRESLQRSSTKDFDTVDTIVESCASKSRRYGAMPVVEDGLISMLQEGTVRFNNGQLREDKESAQTRSFMDETNKLF